MVAYSFASLAFGWVSNTPRVRRLFQLFIHNIRQYLQVRTALFLGLNMGAYVGDIQLLDYAKAKATGRVEAVRAKLRHKKNAMVGCWELWPETIAALDCECGIGIGKDYAAFAAKHGLPDHKALRKTVTQWMEDKELEQASRLYRGEKTAGNQGKFYTKMTPEQAETLAKPSA